MSRWPTPTGPVALHSGDNDREPTDEELRKPGIDPADNVTGEREPPDSLE